jgi:hypothetical protein
MFAEVSRGLDEQAVILDPVAGVTVKEDDTRALPGAFGQV